MEKRVELPVNKSHHIRSGTTFAGLYSIMTSEEYAGKLNAILSDYVIWEEDSRFDYFQDSEAFHKSLRQLVLDDEQKSLKIHSHPFIDDKYAYIYKKSEKMKPGKAVVEVKVDYLQEANAWSNVKLVLSKGVRDYDLQYKEAVFSGEYSLRLTAKGRLVLQSPYCHTSAQIRETDIQKTVYLRLESGMGWCAKYSFDGELWEVLYESETEKPEYTELGLYVSPKVSPFFYEFFPCHLQLCFSRATKVMMPHVETEDRYFSNMLEVYHLPSETILFPDEELLHFFMELLSKKYYVRLRLNEFYVPETPSYQKLDFAHVNYLYGYDKEKGVFKLIGYNRYLLFTEISFSDFLLAYRHKKHLKDKITLYKYNCQANPQKFPLKETIDNLQAYINGTNHYLVTLKRAIVPDEKEPFVYGVDIFEAIADNTEFMDSFIRDVRLAYRLQERYLIIKNMLELMFYNRILSEEVYKKQVEAFEGLFNYVEVMRKLILKHYVKSIPDIYSQIKEMLLKLKELDEKATRELIGKLEESEAFTGEVE